MGGENQGRKRKRQGIFRGSAALPLTALVLAAVALTAAGWIFVIAPGGFSVNIFKAAAGVSSRSSTSSSEIPSAPDSRAAVSSAASSGDINDASVDNEAYFQKSLFIGDSITSGISMYKLLNSARVISGNGMSTYSALTNKAAASSGGATPATAAQEYQPSRIFILLGANDITFMSTDTFVKYYGQLIDSLAAKCPDAKITVQSIFPVTAAYEQKNTACSNSKIDSYNTSLQKMCSDRSIAYADVASVLKDDSGKLKAEYSNGGINIKLSAYYVWLNYLAEQK